MAAMRSTLALLCLGAGACVAAPPVPAPHKTTHIIFVMTDGLRWQEVFRGAEASLMTKENGAVEDIPALKASYWRETPAERRAALMPFFWRTIAAHGQIYGNRDLGADAYVTNGLNFSYPGYSETLCGYADPRVDSNDKVPNRNVTVFEWLSRKPSFHDSVAAFGAWDVFPFIFNAPRAGFPVNAGWDPMRISEPDAQLDLVNSLKAEGPRVWPDEPFDPLPFHTALEYLKTQKPRLLYLSLGETDDWAHEGNYALYLDAAHRADTYVRELWETVQSMPEYRGATTLIFSPDHGRGSAPVEWKDHGQKIPESKYIWIAILGPDTSPLGERTHTDPVTQSQIAATLAAFLGEDYNAAVPRAGKPISDALPSAAR